MPRASRKRSASAPDGSTATKRRSINSVEIGLGVLESVIALREPASLKSIAEHSGLDSSQAHRYVSSLVNCGLLRQEFASGRYDLGPAALRIGTAALARTDGIMLVDREALEFSRRHEVTTLVAVWGSYGPTIIRWYHGSPPVYTTLGIGSVLPLTRSATGQVFMAYLPDVQLQATLEHEGFRGGVARHPELAAECAQIRARRIASVDGSAVPGLRAHAVPLLGVNSHLVAVVATVASAAIPVSKDRETKARLIEMSERVSFDLGAERSGPHG